MNQADILYHIKLKGPKIGPHFSNPTSRWIRSRGVKVYLWITLTTREFPFFSSFFLSFFLGWWRRNLRWGWVYLKRTRTRILSGIQLIGYFIEFVVVETKWFFSSNVNVILTRQTCGQRSSISEGALENDISERMFLISKCTEPGEARFQKTGRGAVFLLATPAAKFWKRDFSSASERAFPGFLDDLFCCRTPSKKEVFQCTRIHSLLVNWCRLSVESRALTCPFKKIIWLLGHCWVDIPHIHTSEWDSLFFQSCLLSTVTVMPSDSDNVNRHASLQQFRLIHTSTIASTILRIRTTGCMRTRQSPCEIVADYIDEGGHWYQTLDRYCARGPGGGAKKRRGKGDE